LAPAFRERILVLVAEGRLALGLLFPWGHTTSVAANGDERNPASVATRTEYRAPSSWDLQHTYRSTQ
jgi:hypothetical protein